MEIKNINTDTNTLENDKEDKNDTEENSTVNNRSNTVLPVKHVSDDNDLQPDISTTSTRKNSQALPTIKPIDDGESLKVFIRVRPAVEREIDPDTPFRSIVKIKLFYIIIY